MKKIIYRSLPFVFSLLLSSPVWSSVKLGTVQILVGKGSVTRNGQSLPLKLGQDLFYEDVVETNNKSVLILSMSGGIQLKLNSQSKIILKNPRDPGVELLSGSLFVKVKKKKKSSKPKFMLRTKTAVAGVRGTEFFTSYGGSQQKEDLWLCVNSGEVELNALNSKQKVLIKEGEGVSFPANKKISTPRPLPWTKNLNWKMQGKNIENKVDIKEAYTDLLDKDYD